MAQSDSMIVIADSSTDDLPKCEDHQPKPPVQQSQHSNERIERYLNEQGDHAHTVTYRLWDSAAAAESDENQSSTPPRAQERPRL